jgi:hypothetical protein
MAGTLEQRKRQKILLFVALGIALGAVVVLYFGFLKKPTPSEVISIAPTGPSTGGSAVPEERLKKINLDFDFLNEKILSFLKIHGNIPVQKGETGRDNPFNPY